MNGLFRHLTSDRIVKRSLLLAISLLVVTTIYLLVVYQMLPPIVPVFNQLPWGIERLGDKITIFLPLLTSFVFLLINMIFSNIMYEKMPLVIRMISITSLLIVFVTSIFIIRTTLLVL